MSNTTLSAFCKRKENMGRQANELPRSGDSARTVNVECLPDTGEDRRTCFLSACTRDRGDELSRTGNYWR